MLSLLHLATMSDPFNICTDTYLISRSSSAARVRRPRAEQAPLERSDAWQRTSSLEADDEIPDAPFERSDAWQRTSSLEADDEIPDAPFKRSSSVCKRRGQRETLPHNNDISSHDSPGEGFELPVWGFFSDIIGGCALIARLGRYAIDVLVW